MIKEIVILIGLSVTTSSARQISLRALSIEEAKQSNKTTLDLPSNYTSIREHVTDNFSCEGRKYGYYADVENECQIFHVCLPVDYGTSRRRSRQMIRKWSFICPETTQFDQGALTCTTENQMTIDCMESESYYDQSESSENDKNISKTMEATTPKQEKTTSKALLTENLLRQSGVSQKIIQKLPAYIVEQSISQLNEPVKDDIIEISMPLIQLTEPEQSEEENDDSEVITVPLELLEAEVDEELETESYPVVESNDNTIEVPVTEEKVGENKTVRKGFLFKADATRVSNKL